MTPHTNAADMGVANPDIVRKKLQELHDTDGLSWRKIARLPEYRGIPYGTLCSIYHGAKIPRKYYRLLGLPINTVEVEVCEIHGIVHCYDCETQRVIKTPGTKRKKKPSKPRPKYKQMYGQMGILALYLIGQMEFGREERV